MLRLAPFLLAAVVASCATSLDGVPLPAAGPTAALPEPLADPVPVVRVVAGRPDTFAVADLLGADGAVRFGRHPDVTVSRVGADSVAVLARPGFADLALVPVQVGGAEYVVAVESAVWPEVTIAYTPEARPLQVMPRPAVAVVGRFTDAPLALEDRGDGTQARTVAVAPGEYAYRLVVDGDTIPDPAAPETIADSAGVVYSVLTVPATAPGRLRLRVLGPDADDPSVLRLAVERTDADGAPAFVDVDEEEGVVALVDNRPVNDNALDADFDAVAVDLDAAGSGRLRLAVRADGLVSNWVEVDVRDGRLADGTTD